MRTRYSKWAGLCAPLMFSLAACLGDASSMSDQDLAGQSDALSIPAPLLPKVAEFADPLLAPYALSPQSILVGSHADYARMFGHEPPVASGAGDVFVFYAAGPVPSGGYHASFSYVLPGMTTASLRADAIVGTVLDVPGPDCPVTQERSAPYAVGVIRGANYKRVEFRASKHPVDCVSCDDTECDPGSHCELQDVVCVRAPCYPLPECVPDEPSEPTCSDHACPDGSHCELKQVQCIKAPCYPIPECVPDPKPQPLPCETLCPDGPLSCPVLECHPRPRDPCFDIECGEGLHCIAPADRPQCVR